MIDVFNQLFMIALVAGVVWLIRLHIETRALEKENRRLAKLIDAGQKTLDEIIEGLGGK